MVLREVMKATGAVLEMEPSDWDTVTCGDRKKWELSVALGSVRECTVRLVNCWPFACPAFMLCRKKKSEGKIIKVFIFKNGLNYTVKPHYSWIPSLIILLLVQIYCNCNMNMPDAFQCHSQTYTCWPAAAWLMFGCNSPDTEQTRVSACTLQAGFLQPASAHSPLPVVNTGALIYCLRFLGRRRLWCAMWRKRRMCVWDLDLRCSWLHAEWSKWTINIK